MKNKNNEIVKDEEKLTKREKRKIKREKFSLFMSFLGAVFFIVSIILKASKEKDSPLFPFIIGCTAIYLLAFVIFLLMHRKNSDQISKDTKNFKFVVNTFNLIMDVLFIGSSLLIFIASLNTIESQGLIAIVQTGIAGLLLLIKFILTVSKLVKSVKKKAKSDKKEKEKENKKAR